ncbi:MAG: MoaD/ThiS family protein [Candidatus Bipolaricaulota bacterium]
MIEVSVEIAFSFKRELSEDDRCLLLPDDADALAVLRALVARAPSLERRLFDVDGNVRRDLNAIVNGLNVVRRQGWATRLAAGDRVILLPPLGGG